MSERISNERLREMASPTWRFVGDEYREACLKLVEGRAEVERLRDELEDYQGRLWCALGQPLNIDFITAVKQMRAELLERREAECAEQDRNRPIDKIVGGVIFPSLTVGTTTRYPPMPREAWEKLREERDGLLVENTQLREQLDRLRTRLLDLS